MLSDDVTTMIEPVENLINSSEVSEVLQMVKEEGLPENYLFSSSEEGNEQVSKLLVDPESLEGVASAYRYKLTLLNPELNGCSFYFPKTMDVFNFNDVNKKRALKKEEWPSDSTLDNPLRHDVDIKLMAGNTEIQNCGVCNMWKDLTRKPFLVLTPHGNRCVQFVKKPFILLIFRCCPKFHSFAKQFKLVITITCPATGAKYTNEVNIYRKKMNNNNTTTSKKRKSTKKDTEQNAEPIAQEITPSSKISHSITDVSMASQEDPALESAISRYEMLFPQSLFRTPSLENNSDSFSQQFPSYLQPKEESSKRPKTVARPQYEQPFQQYQHEIEQFQQHYEQGQPRPQGVYSPQELYNLLYPKAKPTNPPNSNSSPKTIPMTQKIPKAPLSPFNENLFDSTFEDKSWLDFFQDSENTKDGLSNLLSEDQAISFNSLTNSLGF